MPDHRTRVAERVKNCCEYCLSQEQYSSDSFSVEHIVPLIKGGKNILDNLAFAVRAATIGNTQAQKHLIL
jgi:5-methylcytosine-specific restriction endonuclease McrA